MINDSDVRAFLETDEALREALGLCGVSPIDVRLLARGEYNENYLFTHPETGQKLLFRVNLGSQMHLSKQIEYEAHALFLLKASQRVPDMLYVDDSKAFFGKGILVEEFLPGRPLDYSTDLALAAQILADIHSVSVPQNHGLITPESPLLSMLMECDTMFARYRAWDKANRQVCTRIDRWFEKARTVVEVEARAEAQAEARAEAQAEAEAGRTISQRHIINTELNSGNFLINEGTQAYLIDWEKPLFAEVEQDLAHFLCPTTTFWKTDTLLDEKAIECFLEHYRNAVDNRFDTSSLEARLPDYFVLTCLRGVTWCAMALAQHECNERKVANDYTLEKIKTYLGGTFLSLIEERYYS